MDAGNQPWELPTAAHVAAVRAAAVKNRDHTRRPAPRSTTSFNAVLEAGELAHKKARQLIDGGRRGKKEVQLRQTFLRRDDVNDPKPIGVTIGTAAVPAYVALLWLASGTGLAATDSRVANDPRFQERPDDAKDIPVEHPRYGPRLCAFDAHMVDLKGEVFGALLGYGGSPKSRSERTRNRLAELEAARLVRRDRTPGPLLTVQLRHESGNGEPYTKPSNAREGPFPPEDYYLRIPSTVFTNGWAAVLSARAFLAYLLILAQADMRAANQRLGTATRAKKFPVSDDRFYPGRSELAWWGLIELRAGGKAVRGSFHKVTYHAPVDGATRLRPSETFEHAIAPAGLAADFGR